MEYAVTHKLPPHPAYLELQRILVNEEMMQTDSSINDENVIKPLDISTPQDESKSTLSPREESSAKSLERSSKIMI